jgi:ferredoxin-NADP reductase/ferredoxin
MSKASSKLWFRQVFQSAASPVALRFSALPTSNSTLKDEASFNSTVFTCLFKGLDVCDIKPELKRPVRFENIADDRTSGDQLLDNRTTQVRGGVYKMKVVNSYFETPDTKTFRLQALDGSRLNYKAGQYVTIGVTIDGSEYRRSYSIASSPSRPETLDITVKRTEGGIVSNGLIDGLQVGDSLTVGGPYGHFGRALDSQPKLLFLAAGSGIVPIMSMLRQLTDTERPVKAAVLASFKTEADIIFREELKLLAGRHCNLTLDITLTGQQTRAEWSGLRGRIDQWLVLKQVPDIIERYVYLCGPEPFMRVCAGFLAKLGHPDSQLFCESFQLAASLFSPLPQQPTPVGAQSVFRIYLKRSRIGIDTDGLAPLLNALDQAHVPLNRDCRNGHCGECMVKCLQGQAVMAGEVDISDADRKQGWIYACCAFPKSDLVLDL